MKSLRVLKEKQSQLKFIFLKALNQLPPNNIMKVTNEEGVLKEHSIIRRGYKLTYTVDADLYELFKIHSTNGYYKYAHEEIIDIMCKEGFVNYVDKEQIDRLKQRVSYYNKKIDKANEDRNDSLIVHWRKRRKELIDSIIQIESNLK